MSDEAQAPWLEPITTADSLAITTSLLVTVPGLQKSGVYMWREHDGWRSWAEWGDQLEHTSDTLGPFPTSPEAERAARQYLHERAKRA